MGATGTTETVAHVPIMITAKQRRDLRDAGYTDKEIDGMKPEEAHKILGVVPDPVQDEPSPHSKEGPQSHPPSKPTVLRTSGSNGHSDAQPPYDLDAERAVLAAVLLDGTRRDDVAQVLTADDWHDKRHRAIWRAMLAMDGELPDYLTLSDYLREHKALKQAGGETYLVDLVALSADLPYGRELAHAEIVKKHAQRRRLIDAFAKGTAEAWSGDPTDALQAATRRLEAIRERQRTDGGAWAWRSLEEMFEPKPPREYVVGGLLPVPSLSIFYGHPGDLKSMIAHDLAVCVAGGEPWLEPLPEDDEAAVFQVTQGPVLCIDVDMGIDATELRLVALARGHNVQKSAPLAAVSYPDKPGFVASNPEAVRLVIDQIQATGAKLVIVDNLISVSGGVDENSSAMGPVMDGLSRIAKVGRCAVVVIHHKNKTTKYKRARGGDNMRGHSSIEGALELALDVVRECDTVTLWPTKTRHRPVQPFCALWTYEQDESGELAKGRFFGLGKPEAAELSKQEQAELCIMMDIQNGMNQSQLVGLVKQEAGIGRHTALSAIRRLVDSGKLIARVGQSRGAIEYDKA